MTGSLSPAEIVDSFEKPLTKAREEVAAGERAESELLQQSDEISEALSNERLALAESRADLRAAEQTVLGAIESSTKNVTTRMSSKETLSAIMRAKGKSKKEIKTHHEHVDKLNEEEQPVVIIAGNGLRTATEGLISVIYGRKVDESGRRSFLKTYTGTETPEGQRANEPGARAISIVTKSPRGFKLDAVKNIELFAKKPKLELPDAILSNAGHPFEDIHFAASAEEVEETVEKVTTGKKSPADNAAIEALGLPTMVAYGEEGVLEVSKRIAAKGDLYKQLAKRCLDGVVDNPNMPELIIYDNASQQRQLNKEFRNGLTEYFEAVSPEAKEKASHKLAFLAPLQEFAGVQTEDILGEVKRALTNEINTGDIYRDAQASSKIQPLTGDKSRIRDRLEDWKNELRSYGLDFTHQISKFDQAIELDDIALEIEVEAIEFALEFVAPATALIARHRLKKAIKSR